MIMGHNREHNPVDPGAAGSTLGDPIHPSWVGGDWAAKTVREASARFLPTPVGGVRTLTLAEHYLSVVAVMDADRDCVTAAAALREAADRIAPAASETSRFPRNDRTLRALTQMAAVADDVWCALDILASRWPFTGRRVSALSALNALDDATEGARDALAAAGWYPIQGRSERSEPEVAARRLYEAGREVITAFAGLMVGDEAATALFRLHSTLDAVVEALRDDADRLDLQEARVDAQALLDLHRAADGLWSVMTDRDTQTSTAAALFRLEGALDATEDYLTAVGLLPGVTEPVVGASVDGRATA